MNKVLIFLCLACGILLCTIITICNAPIINHSINADDWGVLNCQYYADNHKDIEDDETLDKDTKDETLKSNDKSKHLCDRQKAMYGLEYAAFILDLVFGFSCTLLSLLNFFGVGKSFEKLIGIIGLISGIIGFIFTFTYIIYSGYIFTNDIQGRVPKLDKNREFAKWTGSKYECLFYEEDDDDSIYAKWSDLGKKQYNYHKDFSFPDDNSKYNDCNRIRSKIEILNNDPDASRYYPTDLDNLCKNDFGSLTKSQLGNCDYLFFGSDDIDGIDDISYKYIYDKWVTTIIFGCIIIALNLGLAVFGFLIFKESGSSSGLVTIK
jgi:hypothetical protein